MISFFMSVIYSTWEYYYFSLSCPVSWDTDACVSFLLRSLRSSAVELYVQCNRQSDPPSPASLTHTHALTQSPLENNYSMEADPVRLRQIKNLIYRFAVRFSGSGVDTVYCNKAIGYPCPNILS